MENEEQIYVKTEAPAREEPKIFSDINAEREFDAVKLIEVISYWMSYQQGVSRSSNLLHEASFRYPIAEYLERNLKIATALELQHPVFNKPMDFQWLCNEKHYYLECKYVRKSYTDSKSEVQRFFNDICRLYYCIRDVQVDECYFIACGPQIDFNVCFRFDEVKPLEEEPINKQRYHLFPPLNLNNPVTISPINRQEFIPGTGNEVGVSINNLYYHFADDYNKDTKQPNVVENTIEVTIQLVKLLEDREQTVGIWQITKGSSAQFDNKTLNKL